MKLKLLNARRPRGSALIIAMSIVLLLAGLSTMLLLDMRTRSMRTQVNMENVKAFEAAEAGLDAALRNLNTGGAGIMGIGWTDTNGDGKIDSAEVSAGGYNPATMDGTIYTADGYEAPKGRAIANDYTDKFDVTTARPRPEQTEFDFYAHAKTFGDVRFFTYAVNWATDGIDNDGNGLKDFSEINGEPGGPDDPLRDENEENWYTIWSTGFSNPSTPDGKFTTVEAIVQAITYENSFELDAALELQIAPFIKP